VGTPHWHWHWHVKTQRRRCNRRGTAFTLAELLVCIGLITALLSILLPSVGAVRRQARLVTCTSNIQRICRAFYVYAGLNDGNFPPNKSSPSPGQFWCDRKRLDSLLAHNTPANISSLGGGALACPDDKEGGQRSYAMNFWASSDVDGYLRTEAGRRGVFWSTAAAEATTLILVAEAWSGFGSGDWFTAPEVIGFAGDRPGQRFGGLSGLAPPAPMGRFGLVKTELPFPRHRSAGGKGRVQIGFADGHVALLSESDLLRPDGKSRYVAMWSPADPRLEP
jgi:prepilin-type processing-associated H-X9-DG protein